MDTETLVHILALLEELSQLCASSDYELYQLTYEHPALLIQIVDQQAETIRTEIAALELTAQQLADEIVI